MSTVSMFTVRHFQTVYYASPSIYHVRTPFALLLASVGN